MPLLGSVNAGIYRAHDPIPWPGQQTAQSGQPPRADTPLMRLGLEQQKEQQINAIFKKHGTDYDGAVEEVMGIDQEEGQRLAGLVADGRKKAAQQHVSETDSSLKDLEMVQRGVQVAIKDPTKYPVLLQELAKKPGWSRYAQMAPDPNDPDLVPKLEAILPALGDTTEFLKVNRQSALDYINGDVRLGAARSLAEATTPEKRQVVVAQLQGGGMGALADTWKTPEEAAAARDQMIAQKVKEKPATEKAANIGSFEDYVVRTYGPNPTPDQIIAARKKYGQADDRPRVSVSVSGATGPGMVAGLTTGEGGGLEYEGTLARLKGETPKGMSRGGAAQAIANEAARQVKMLGQTPAVSLQMAAMRHADTKALDQMVKMQSTTKAFENKAMDQLDIVDGLSDKVWRTSSPLINRAIMSGQTEIVGDKDATLLLNAILTASTEYAKIMTGGTGSAAAISDSAQKEAQKLLNAGMSKGTLRGATALMRQEMGLTNKGYDVVIKDISNRLSGQPAAASDPLTVVAPNGKTYKFTSPEKAAAFKKAAGIQ